MRPTPIWTTEDEIAFLRRIGTHRPPELRPQAGPSHLYDPDYLDPHHPRPSTSAEREAFYAMRGRRS